MPPEWLVKRVLLGPAPVRKAAASRATDETERWMLLQPAAVRQSFVREVLEKGGDEDAWMLLQPDAVRRSYVADVLAAKRTKKAL
jgi:hypothetical protein